LVYEVQSQKFYHYDTLCGANYNYVQPLVAELLQQIQQNNEPNLAEYLVTKHNIKQGNGYDCGVAVISIIKRIIALKIKQN
jgi:Ulp1 family protease